jgi:lysophospholipase L1-like esterase
MTRMRRTLPILAALLTASCARPATSPATVRASRGATTGATWIATWSPSQSAMPARPPAGTEDRVPTYVNATIRQIVRTTIGGDHLRIRISNEYGDRPLVVGAAHVARRTTAAAIDPGSDRALTFGGKPAVVVRAGAIVTSDPLAYVVPQLGDLAVSLYLPDSARTSTRHALAVQTTYVSRGGNQVSAPTFTADTTMRSWLFLTAVEVTNPRAAGAIVAIGNSITDGYAATVDSNRRWPDVLARRLLASPAEPVRAVVNAGISGNRVLTLGSGPSLLSRFDRDVLLQPGVTHVIVLEGINDISRDAVDSASAEQLIDAHRQLAERAHERGLVIYGATLTPFERPPDARSEAREVKRQAVNEWIRHGGAYDGVIDFDSVTRDPAQPRRFLPKYDSGDHLHPSDAGYQAMGEAIDLALFRTGRRR